MKCKENLCKEVRVEFINIPDGQIAILEKWIAYAVQIAKEEICDRLKKGEEI